MIIATQRRLMVLVFSLLAVVVPLAVTDGVTEAAKVPQVELLGTSQSCLGDGCSWVKATRSGVRVTIYGQGISYTPYSSVRMTISVLTYPAMKSLWRMSYTFKANEYGRTPAQPVFIDCNVGVYVQVWTWRANLTGYVPQPEAHTTA